MRNVTIDTDILIQGSELVAQCVFRKYSLDVGSMSLGMNFESLYFHPVYFSTSLQLHGLVEDRISQLLATATILVLAGYHAP